MSRVWFITGARTGLGRAFAEVALEQDERVVSASRSTEPFASEQELRLPLDVTDRGAVFAAFEHAADHFGRIDVVANTAGTLSLGMVEEFTEAEARAQLETNVFGALWVSQAAMRAFRAQRSGRLLQISSLGGAMSAPMSGLYSASKFALEGFSEALRGEAAAFGAAVTIIEPGGYDTPLYTAMATTTPIDDYAGLREEIERMQAGGVDSAPRLAAEAVWQVAGSPDPPTRLILGGAAYDWITDAARARLADWASGEAASRAADRVHRQES
ncbi:SDR family NAD(P)-dependent oxidoreductase [Microbacteriaceae bacterium VKM Ac-2855]|nr:SDR family NAD(P)-dependent oxidoreductase [Microbacteriaceae bacterium VKM Ac-2855]